MQTWGGATPARFAKTRALRALANHRVKMTLQNLHQQKVHFVSRILPAPRCAVAVQRHDVLIHQFRLLKKYPSVINPLNVFAFASSSVFLFAIESSSLALHLKNTVSSSRRKLAFGNSITNRFIISFGVTIFPFLSLTAVNISRLRLADRATKGGTIVPCLRLRVPRRATYGSSGRKDDSQGK